MEVKLTLELDVSMADILQCAIDAHIEERELSLNLTKKMYLDAYQEKQDAKKVEGYLSTHMMEIDNFCKALTLKHRLTLLDDLFLATGVIDRKQNHEKED